MNKIFLVRSILEWIKNKSFIEKIEQIFSLDEILHTENTLPKIKLSSWISEVETYSFIKDNILENILCSNNYMKYSDPLWDYSVRKLCALYESLKFSSSINKKIYTWENICFTEWWTWWISSIFEYLSKYKSDKKVLTFSPSYYIFNVCSEFYKLNISFISTLEDEYEKNFISAINSWIWSIIVANPDNPSGILYRKSFIKKIILLAKKYNILLIFDSVFENLVFHDAPPPDYLCVAHDYHDYVCIKSFSKDLNLPWFRIWYILSWSQEIIWTLWKIQEIRHFSSFSSTIKESIKVIFFLQIANKFKLNRTKLLQIAKDNWIFNSHLNENNYKEVIINYNVYLNNTISTYKKNYNVVINFLNNEVSYKYHIQGWFNMLIQLKWTKWMDELSFIINLYLKHRIKIQTWSYFGIKPSVDTDLYFRLSLWFINQQDYLLGLEKLLSFRDNYRDNYQEF